MFGLMKTKTCGLSDEQKLRRRLHYCGTCKTMGALYGQKTRFLLNHDTVFLAEILTALSGDESKSWQEAYQSYNCLSLPQGEMPFALEFAATANVVLTEFKIKDHIADEGKMRWNLAQKTFSRSFKKAAHKLKEWQFPFEELTDILSQQTERESQPQGDSIEEILDYLAVPTATATALFFDAGAKLSLSANSSKQMFTLGFTFGKLIYLLDAFEDYERDLRDGNLNAFRKSFQKQNASDNASDLVENSKLSKNARSKAARILRALIDEVSDNIEKLPLDSINKRLFEARLRNNIERKLKTALPVVQIAKSKVCTPRRPVTLSQRWNQAKEIAKELTAAGFTRLSWVRSWQYVPAFLIVAAVAFIAPQEAAKAKSWQDCAGLGLNLMFLGSLIGAVFALPIKMAANLPPNPLNEAERQERRQRWFEYCCEGCDCGCECCNCCEGCDCGCCNCCDGCGCDC